MEVAGAADDASSAGDKENEDKDEDKDEDEDEDDDEDEDEDGEVVDDTEGRPLKAGTLKSYVNAISELYCHQVSTGKNTNPPI